ncbi:MAG: hypothetical protein Q9168_003965 [Polycauliona sp. 1 TL-2023]
MALAKLCCQIREFREQFPVFQYLRLHAFIVDHKARPDSAEEAKRVKRWLREQFGPNNDDGLKTDILTLEWPSGVKPSELPNFETEARRLRYQALGKACHEADISSLLVGHHEADKKETLIMRLVEGYRGEGLRGVPTESDIPECQGIYGASESGGRSFMTTQKESAEVLYLREGRMEGMLPPLKEYRSPGFEYGGVRTYRPLLAFNKQDLQNTLKRGKVPWVEDTTNQDPTVSLRNAIRLLMQNGSLPKALSSPSLGDAYTLETAADNIQMKYGFRNKQADYLFQALDGLSFDARAGRLEVRIPVSKELNRHLRVTTTDEEHIHARLVRLLFQLVSPQSQISLQSLETATKRMFLDTDEALPGRTTEGSPVFSFTAAGVYCERVDVSNVKLRSIPGKFVKQFYVENTWRLSRQPYHQTQPEPECIFPAVYNHKPKGNHRPKSLPTPFPPPKPNKDNRIKYPEPPWQLWDGRYWIQVVNPTVETLKVLPLTEDRLVRLVRLKSNIEAAEKRAKIKTKKNGDTKRSTLLQTVLKEAAPGRLRYTLPAIVDHNDNVLVLPTLNFETHHDLQQKIEWRIRYRRVVFPDKIDQNPNAVIALPEKELQTVKPPAVTAHHQAIIEERREAKAKKKKEVQDMKRKRKEREIREEQGQGPQQPVADVFEKATELRLRMRGEEKEQEREEVRQRGERESEQERMEREGLYLSRNGNYNRRYIRQ